MNIYKYEINEQQISYIQESIRMFAIPIEKLTLDPRNARVHKQKSLDSICASLKKFGQQTPIVFDENYVVKKGNGTLESARILGWKYIAAFRTDLKGKELDAWAIADNKTTENSSWNTQTLSQLITEFEEEDRSLVDSLGFDENQLNSLMGSLKEEQESIEEDTEMVLKMELRPYQSYDYILVLCDNTYDWNYLYEFFNLQKVSASYVNSGKVGLGRGIRASELVQKIKFYKEQIARLQKELKDGKNS